MERLNCKATLKGRTLAADIPASVDPGNLDMLICHKHLVPLPDSDELMLEDPDGFRYTRAYCGCKDFYLFTKI